MENINIKKTISIDYNELRDGDILLIMRLDGLDPLICWGTGSQSGHTAMVLTINSTKYIIESTDKNPFGKSRRNFPT